MQKRRFLILYSVILMKRDKPVITGEEKIVFKGKIFEIAHTPMKIGKKEVIFETARRAPGVRMLIVKGNKILIIKEYRPELKQYDYRLPGGKVFDRLEQYDAARKNKRDMIAEGKKAVMREAEEEIGIIPLKMKHLHTTAPNATVDWQLYYFLIDKFNVNKKQKLEHGEDITPLWKTKQKIKKMCLKNEIKEERSAYILLRFIENEFQ